MKTIDFQTKAIEALKASFKKLWYAPGSRLPLVFKAPTGSGKTYMTTSLLHSLGEADFDDDVAWIWITFSDELAMQSKGKFEDYFHPNVGRRLLTSADFAEGMLKRDDVLFINWQKLVSQKAENRKLRRPDNGEPRKESGFYFEDVIEATHAAGRKIALVIDESHKNMTEGAYRDVIDVVQPKVMVEVSATPRRIPNASDLTHNKAGYVEVEREDVVKAGLIKEAIVSQTEEELASGSDEDDLDHKLLDLAMKRREALAEEWGKTGSDVKPLVLIQLPDDDSGDKAQGIPTKEEVVVAYLKSRGVADEKIAYWFDKKKSKCVEEHTIEANDAPEEFLLFKYAAGTGWDCPRAQMLAMFREIQSNTFKIQTLGRILRNPEPEKDLTRFPNLRLGYLYTNYTRNEVENTNEKPDTPVLTRHSQLIERLAEQIQEGVNGYVVDEHMTSEFISRADYGDLGQARMFEKSFIDSMDKWFKLTAHDMMAERTKKVGCKGVDLSPTLTYDIIVDAKWKSDVPEGTDGGGTEVKGEVSAHDAERMFTRACEQLLTEQTEDDAKVTNVSRSEGILRGRVQRWLLLALPDVESNTGRYKIFLKDLSRDAASVFRPAITNALKEYAPIRKAFVEKKRKNEENKQPEIFTLKRVYDYSELFEEYEKPTQLSAVQPFRLLKEYPGRKNETAFIGYLEQQADKIEWWFKNGNEGKDYFGLKYFNADDNGTRLFYPDWVVKFKDGRIGIFDTKGGQTATHPQGREKGLHDKIAAMNKAAKMIRFVGGLVVRENNTWHYHDGENYSYRPGKLGQGWNPLSELFK